MLNKEEAEELIDELIVLHGRWVNQHSGGYDDYAEITLKEYESAKEKLLAALSQEPNEPKGPVAVLTYRSNGVRGCVGQTVGADGRGDYCILYEGDPGEAEQRARDDYKRLKALGMVDLKLVTGHEGFCGPFIKWTPVGGE